MRALLLAGFGAASLTASPAVAQEDGAALYEQNCAACHGPEREGMAPAFPSLVGIGERLEADEIETIIAQGRGLMPPFGQLSETERDALVAFLTEGN